MLSWSSTPLWNVRQYFFPFIHHQFIIKVHMGCGALLHSAFSPGALSFYELKEGRAHALVRLVQSNSQFKNMAKSCLPPSMLSLPSIVHVQGFPAPQMFYKQQMSPFQLCSCCSCHVFSDNFAQFFLLKRVKCPPFFLVHNQNNSTSSPGLIG